MKGDVHNMENAPTLQARSNTALPQGGKTPPQNTPPEIFLRPARYSRGCNLGDPLPMPLTNRCQSEKSLESV